MQIGVVFPQTEAGADPAAIRTYVQTVESLGYGHLLAYDHVLGADPAVHAPWSGPYDLDTTFHEPFVLFGYVAALTTLELVTGILVLPQRQTALVAKQAAGVDLLTNGRFRLGVGIGWNSVEYSALGKDFSNRGNRSNEQIELLRRLWTEPTVTFQGKDESCIGAGICPQPVQRPIPIWIGGNSEPAFRRAGRLADGWLPSIQPGPELDAARETVSTAARAAGRDPALLGMEGHLYWPGNLDSALSQAERWRDAGASHLSITTMDARLEFPDGHLAVLSEFAAALQLHKPGAQGAGAGSEPQR